MKYFDLLNGTEKRKALKKVDKYFDRAFYFKTQFKHNIFKKQYPFEYSNTPIGDLREDALKLNEYLFEESQKWIAIIFDKLTKKQALKQLAKRKSNYKSTYKKFCKNILKI